jgi:hypothetical protein
MHKINDDAFDFIDQSAVAVIKKFKTFFTQGALKFNFVNLLRFDELDFAEFNVLDVVAKLLQFL